MARLKPFRPPLQHQNVDLPRVALNTCVSFDKKKRRRQKAQLFMTIDLFNDKSRNTEQARMLHSRISLLKPIDRAIVLLWLEDISYDEIATIIGISLKNVSVRLFRIRQKLKNSATTNNE